MICIQGVHGRRLPTSDLADFAKGVSTRWAVHIASNYIKHDTVKHDTVIYKHLDSSIARWALGPAPGRPRQHRSTQQRYR